MGGGISKMANRELVATIQYRYQQSTKKDKGRILDEFTAITGHHRKHGIRLLGGTADNKCKQAVGRRIYDEAVREAVIVVGEASDRICGKRLKAALPNLVDSMKRHGHLSLGPVVREHLLAASAATLDRTLKPIRATAGSRRKRRRRPYMGGQIAGQTMVHLYKAVRLHVNFLQPSFKLLEKIRDRSRVIKRYSPPVTPCDRVMQHDEISATVKKELREYRAGLDPVALLSSIREAQPAMAAMSSPPTPGSPPQ